MSFLAEFMLELAFETLGGLIESALDARFNRRQGLS